MSNMGKVAVATAAVALAGCGLPGTFYAEDFANALISGSNFNSELAKAYQQRANNAIEFDENWILAGMYSEKGQAALDGQTVLPWKPCQYIEQPAYTRGVEPSRAAKYNLDNYRRDLISALDNGGRANRPYACAQAQAHYDWLVDETYQDTPPAQVDEEDKIAADFQRALSQCGYTTPAPVVRKVEPVQANEWVVYFGFDRDDLTAEAQNVVANAAQTVKSTTNRMLAVTGFTDTSGSRAYNQKLSVRRANNVANALITNGVNTVDRYAKGEDVLAKATADGVREPLNRRAVIAIR